MLCRLLASNIQELRLSVGLSSLRNSSAQWLQKGVPTEREELQPELPQCQLLATNIQALMVWEIQDCTLCKYG